MRQRTLKTRMFNMSLDQSLDTFSLMSSSQLQSLQDNDYPISWRWWATLTSPIILFTVIVAIYSVIQTDSSNSLSSIQDIFSLNSINALILLLWSFITFHQFKSPLITVSDSGVVIKDMLGGKNRVLNWNEIEEILLGKNQINIKTKRCEVIAIQKYLMAKTDYESLFAQIRHEIMRRQDTHYKKGRYGVVMNGPDAYITYDCFGTFSKITELAGYLKRRKVSKTIQKIYICINGSRIRYSYRITDKNLAHAINLANSS